MARNPQPLPIEERRAWRSRALARKTASKTLPAAARGGDDDTGNVWGYVALRYMAAVLVELEERHGVSLKRSKQRAARAVAVLEQVLGCTAGELNLQEPQLRVALDLHERAFSARCTRSRRKGKALADELDNIVELALDWALHTCATLEAGSPAAAKSRRSLVSVRKRAAQLARAQHNNNRRAGAATLQPQLA